MPCAFCMNHHHKSDNCATCMSQNMDKVLSRKKRARILLWWRANLRWKSHSDVKPCSDYCTHIRASEDKLTQDAKELFNITMSSVYREIKESRYIKSKWRRCPCCHTLHLRESITKMGGRCCACQKYKWENHGNKTHRAEKKKLADKTRREKIKQSPLLLATYKKAQRAWYDKRKKEGRHLDHKYRRRARELLSTASGDVIKRPNVGFCYYCKKKVIGSSLHMDHVVPLSKGGAHASYNLVVSCSTCNVKKHAAMPNRWTPNGQLELVLSHA